MIRHRMWLAAIAAQTLACGAAGIYEFSAQPRQVCPQTKTIQVGWAVDGSIAISAQPPLPDLARAVSEGGAVARRPIAWQGAPGAPDTTITLTATRTFGKPTYRQQVIHVVTPGQVSTLAPDRAEITCDPLHRTVVGVARFAADEYDDAVVIRSLRNAAERPITVTHRGGVWTVPPQQEIPLSEQRPKGRSTSTGGSWVISAPLLDGEVCFTPSVRPALDIALGTTLGCLPPGETGGSP